MYNTVSPFDKLTWGDPMFAQIAGTDAQAYATDPASNVLQNMTTGVEQAPSSLSEYVAGANQPAQQAANAGSGAAGSGAAGSCSGCNAWTWYFKPCCWSYLNPVNAGNWTGANQAAGNGGGGVNLMGAKDFQQLAVFVVVALLAIGIILLGVKSIMEV